MHMLKSMSDSFICQCRLSSSLAVSSAAVNYTEQRGAFYCSVVVSWLVYWFIIYFWNCIRVYTQWTHLAACLRVLGKPLSRQHIGFMLMSIALSSVKWTAVQNLKVNLHGFTGMWQGRPSHHGEGPLVLALCWQLAFFWKESKWHLCHTNKLGDVVE